jgi:prepilin-type N-terminal cleavage/methylation domain-containing protein
MKPKLSDKRSGFTLIELLLVIAIICVLTTEVFAGIFLPSVESVMKKAKQTTASTKLRNITQAAIVFHDGRKYIKSGSWSTINNSSAATIAEYAAVLAYNTNLNTGEVWYVDTDKLNENTNFPKQVLTGGPGSEQINPKFKTPSKEYGYQAWTAYTPTPKNLDGNTPLLWTRGLSSAGSWDATTGVWGADGGHIGYGDSHITWCTNTTDDENGSHNGIFVHRLTGESTQDWKLAVSKDVTATELSSK